MERVNNSGNLDAEYENAKTLIIQTLGVSVSDLARELSIVPACDTSPVDLIRVLDQSVNTYLPWLLASGTVGCQTVRPSLFVEKPQF